MTMAASDGLANAVADFLATQFPAGAILDYYSGARPGSVHTAPTGTKLASIVLPATPWTAAAAREILKQGAWTTNGLAGAGAGTNIGYARLRTAGDLGTTNTTDKRCDFNVGATGSGADIEVDNVNVANGQPVTVTSFFLGA